MFVSSVDTLTVSHHPTALADAGLVIGEKRGRQQCAALRCASTMAFSASSSFRSWSRVSGSSLYCSSTRLISASMARFWLSSWSHKVLWSRVVVGDVVVVVGETVVVGGSVGGAESGGGLVGGGGLAAGGGSGGATVTTGVVVGSELDGDASEVGTVGSGAGSSGAGPGGVERGAVVAARVDAGASVAVALGTRTSPNTVAGSAVVGTSSSPAVTGTDDGDDVVVLLVDVGRVVGGAGADNVAGGGIGPSPAELELGPSQSATRTKRTTSSTAMTIVPAVLPDGR
jgi:hypothetical protein